MARGKKFQCVDFFTSTHSDLMNEIEKYLSYEDKIECNELVSVRKARATLKNIARLCIKRREELLTTYRLTKDKMSVAD